MSQKKHSLPVSRVIRARKSKKKEAVVPRMAKERRRSSAVN